VARLVETIVEAYREAVTTSPWLSAQARTEARRKLDRLTIRIGYPDAWRSYRTLDIMPGDLVGNVERGRRLDGAMRLGRQRAVVDPRLWLIPPQTVNAYYAPGTNEMVVPAAILQPPFFDPDAEDAVNYGAIGAIIGHEIGHALDDRGHFYDAAGRARDWWTRDDADAYIARARVLVDQFDRYEPAAGARVDGMRTLRENVNDLGGLSVAYAAYVRSLDGRPSPVIDGLTGAQRFFVAYARIWRSKERDAYLRQWVISQPHAPPRFRVNGIVTHVPAFYEAFAVKAGDGLFREPTTQVRIW
jgi:predicted metalloendopeptidase